MRDYPNHYRIRIGNYRVGIEVHGDNVEVMRLFTQTGVLSLFPLIKIEGRITTACHQMSSDAQP